MSILSRFRRRKDPYKAATEEEQISRCVYLLNTLHRERHRERPRHHVP